MASKKTQTGTGKLDQLVAESRQNRESREQGYREQSLKLYPWICGRCRREFTRDNVQQLTVHHRDHNHDNNPPDGSNWELLCVYCHDNEHQRLLEADAGSGTDTGKASSSVHQPFADLKSLLNK
jgi:hypothetical protein